MFKLFAASKWRIVLLLLLAALLLLAVVMLKGPVGIKAIEEYPAAAEFRRRMEEARELQSLRPVGDVIEVYHKIAQDADKMGSAYENGLARIKDLAAGGRDDEAAAEARKLCEQFIGHRLHEPGAMRAAQLAREGKQRLATEHYVRLLEHFSVKNLLGNYAIEPHLTIARLYYSKGMLDLAEKEYREYIKRAQQPRLKAEGYMGLGDLAAKQEQFRAALENYRQAAQLAKNDPTERVQNALRMAAVLRQMKRFDEAKKTLFAVIQARGGGYATASLVEQDFLKTVDEQAAAIEKTEGTEAAVKVYLDAAVEYVAVPEWTTQWHIKAAQIYRDGRKYGKARGILGRLWRNRPADIDPVWQQARIVRMELDEIERAQKTTAFIDGIRAKIKQDGYHCTIIDRAIEGVAAWSPAGGDYILDGRVTIVRDASLTIKPGTVVKFTINSSLIVYGALHANGEADARIVFESSAPTPSSFDWGLPGDDRAWGGIQFVGRKGSEMRHCIVRHAAIGVLCEESSPTIEQCSISRTGITAIAISNSANPIIRKCRISDNEGDGLMSKGSCKPVIDDCIVERNGLNGMVFGQKCEPTVRNVVVMKNKGSGVRCFDAMGGEISGSRFVDNGGPGITCETSAAPRIVDCEIAGNGGHGLVAGGRAAPTLVNCSIERNTPSGVLCETASPMLDGCTITGNAEFGVKFTIKAGARLSNCSISGNPVGIQVEDISMPTIRRCRLDGNTSWSVVLLGERDLDLSGNWWGVTSPAAIRSKLIRVRDVRGAARVLIGEPLQSAPDIGRTPGEKK